MIEICGIRKSFGQLTAVNDVSLKIESGETFGLLGPNGAGKTTTISMLVGLLSPDAGSIRVDGSDPRIAAVREQIGIAPQSLSLYEDLTARENLRFFAKLYAGSAAKVHERITWTLDFASLTDRADDLVKTYSGGMKRRLNMAVAMIHDPKIILFDEPTVGVDPQSRNHIFDCIEKLAADGRTVLYTTHYMEEAERLCDRVAIMDRGQILAVDTVSNLLKQHGGDSLVTGEIDGDGQLKEEGLNVEPDGKFRLQTNQPLEHALKLARSGVQFRQLQIREPDLEAVFLNLTGRTLRDE